MYHLLCIDTKHRPPGNLFIVIVLLIFALYNCCTMKADLETDEKTEKKKTTMNVGNSLI